MPPLQANYLDFIGSGSIGGKLGGSQGWFILNILVAVLVPNSLWLKESMYGLTLYPEAYSSIDKDPLLDFDSRLYCNVVFSEGYIL